MASQQLKNRITDYEEKWLARNKAAKENQGQADERFVYENLDYDNYQFLNTTDNTYTSIPFNQTAGYFGDDIADGTIIANKSFRGPEGQLFALDELEIEKFKIERDRRNFLARGKQTKYEQYTEPGGEKYTELVFRYNQLDKVGDDGFRLPKPIPVESPLVSSGF